ncbi:MAG: hypothetical protein ACI8PZ_000816 [Myxococcota bacterium]|jgi:hypothetical protein
MRSAILLGLMLACGGPSKPTDTANGGTTPSGATATGTTPTGTTGAGTTPTATTATGTGTTPTGTTPSGTTPTGTTPTGTTPTGTETADTGGAPVGITIELSDAVVCDSPEARNDAWYDTVDLPGEPIEYFWLIGVGVAAVNLDADPELELLRTRDAHVQTFDRAPDGTWTELPRIAMADPSNLSAADYDADGDLDLFIGGLDQPNRLYANDGLGGLTDVTAIAGLGALSQRTMTAAWSDLDLDGDLDLYVGDYGTFPVVIENAEPSQLFLNRGDGTFEDVSHRLPAEVQQGYVFMGGWFDVDRDGTPDLYSIHDYYDISHSRLLIADDAGGFAVDHGSLFHDSFFGMGFAAQDVNGDRVPDVLQSGFNRISLLQSFPSADALGGSAYLEHSSALGLRLLRGAEGGDPTQTFGWGTAWQDFDNDADLDIAMAFGDWEPEIAGPAGRPMNPHPDALWIRGADRFVDSAAEHGFDDMRTNRGLAGADIDRNGWLDLVVATQDGPTTVRTARCGSEHWVNVSLVDHTRANTAAIGSEVTVRTGDTEQLRWITAGSSSMFSAEPAEAHVGLGDAVTIDELVVRFPDGEEARFTDVPADRFVVVTRR